MQTGVEDDEHVVVQVPRLQLRKIKTSASLLHNGENEELVNITTSILYNVNVDDYFGSIHFFLRVSTLLKLTYHGPLRQR